MTLPERSVQWQLNLNEVMTHSGLELNNVAKTYLYFKSSGLNQKFLDDLLLQVHGDMRRFEEVRTLRPTRRRSPRTMLRAGVR